MAEYDATTVRRDPYAALRHPTKPRLAGGDLGGRRHDFARVNGFDERFVRQWDYYLAVCEAAFRGRRLTDQQVVLTREGNDRLPEFPEGGPS